VNWKSHPSLSLFKDLATLCKGHEGEWEEGGMTPNNWTIAYDIAWKSFQVINHPFTNHGTKALLALQGKKHKALMLAPLL